MVLWDSNQTLCIITIKTVSRISHIYLIENEGTFKSYTKYKKEIQIVNNMSMEIDRDTLDTVIIELF